MKKFILSLVAICAATVLFAQDVIVTIDGQQISAKILEISSSEIKYLDFNNQDGPVYVLSIQEILSVQLANGDVKSYERKTAPIVVETTTTTKQSNNTSYLIRTGNRYHYNGIEMRGDVYANFLKNNCTESYTKYQKGRTVSTVGWILLGVGVGLDLGFAWWAPYTGYIGLACEIACIPTLIVGYGQMHSSAEIFNVSCGRSSMASWSVTASGNGIGVALNF